MTDLEGAYNDALKAEGSAFRENATYLDSIQGRIDLFNNSVQSMWMNFIDSDVIKFVVDLGSSFVKIVDDVGVVKTALIGLLTYLVAIKKHNPIAILKGFGTKIGGKISDVQNLSAMTSLFGGKKGLKTMSMDDFNAGPVKAYAEAVKGLTLEQQKARLAMQGLNQEQIEAVLVENQLIATKTKNTAVSSTSALATLKEKNISAAAKLEDYMRKHSIDQVTAATIENAVAAGTLTKAEGAQIIAALGLKGANTGLASSFKLVGESIKTAFMSNPVGMILTIVTSVISLISVIDTFKESAEDAANEAISAANEIKDAFKSASDEFEDNVKTVEGLESEFNRLSAHVDADGMNMSLSTEDYEKYLDIVNTLIDINPRLVSGYDEQGNAIIRKNDAIRDTIDLLEREQKIEAAQYASTENWNTLMEGIAAEIAQAPTKENSQKKFAQDLYDTLQSNVSAVNLAGFDSKYEGHMGTLNLLMDAGVLKVPEWLRNYGNRQAAGIGSGYIANWLLEKFQGDKVVEIILQNAPDIMNYIEDNKLRLVGEDSYFETEDQYNQIISVIEDYYHAGNLEGIIDMYQDDYTEYLYNSARQFDSFYDLDDHQKLFLEDFITAAFPIPTTGNIEEIKKASFEAKDQIEDIVNMFADEDWLKEIFDEGYNLEKGLSADGGPLDMASFRTAVTNFTNEIENLNKISDEYKEALLKAFSLDDSEIFDAWDHVGTILKSDQKGIAENIFTVDDILYIQKYITADAGSLTVAQLQEMVAEHKKATGYLVDSVQTYSSIMESVENFNEVLAQTEEVVLNNTTVTQEYKDSLTALGISTEELNECFYENNPLVVKNATLLKQLVAQKKQEQKATIQEAKAYGQLQYTNTIKLLQQYIHKMQLEVQANGLVSSSTLNMVDSLREQLTALKQTIQQYALLELSLSNAASAYSEFEAAKERDSQLTYGDSMVEMLQTINEGYKTGQVGSEAFQAAVKALVPPEVYEDIDNVQEKMRAIHDYIDKNPVFADYFTIDDGDISITMDNIEAFLQDGLDDGLGENFGVFTGTIEDFDLAPHIDSIEDLAKAYGITESAALAMLTEFEKYDASWGDIIYRLTTTQLDRNIDDATTALDEAITAQEEFIKSGQPLYDENGKFTEGYEKLVIDVNQAKEELDNATNAAADNATSYTRIQAVIKGMSGEIKYTQEQADALARSLNLLDENGEPHIAINEDGTLSLTQSQIDTLNSVLKGIEENPTIVDVQLAYDKIDSQIQELNKYLTDPDNYNGTILAELNITNSEDAEAKVQELTADRDAIQLIYNITTTTADKDQDTMKQLATWEANGVKIVISGDTTSIDGAIADVNSTEMEDKPVDITADPTQANSDIDSVDENDIADKKPFIAMTGVSTALRDIDSINDALDGLSGTRHVTIDVSYTGGESGGVNVDGNFHVPGRAFAGGTIGAPRSEEALVGELGPELLVRNGRWTTVGANGAEFTQVKKGDIIFNHRQTEQLLKNGYVTGRGKAYASGTAYGFGIYNAYVGDDDAFKNGSNNWVDPYTNTSSSLSDSISDVSDAADEFAETFDWIEIRLEEINEQLDLMSAKLENATNYAKKNNIIDEMMGINETKLKNLTAGIKEYSDYAAKLLAKVPAQYRDAAQNGAIAITEFAGEANEATVEAIENYREWAQKVADLRQEAEETKATLRELAIQKIDNAQESGDVRATVEASQTEKLQNAVDYDEEKGLIASPDYYAAMMENSAKTVQYLTKARDEMQKEFDNAVESGILVRGSDAWYEELDKLYQIDGEIDEAIKQLEEFQNAINDIYWDNFDELINRFDYITEDAQSLIDLMDSVDMVTKPEGKTYEGGTVKFWTADDVKWTKEGLASMGLHAQKLELAEEKAKQYAIAIDDLTEDYKAGRYSEIEYQEKLAELTKEQYDAIEAAKDEKEAIVELNEARIDMVKDGLEKEIEAYEELIEKQKEQLDSEKDLYDFQKNTADQQKNIADIERQLAALAYDNSLSAAAKRKQLEAELAEAQYELQDTYYNRSVEDKQTALDAELESFRTEKEAEIATLEEYLTNIEQVVTDSLGLVRENADAIGQTLTDKTKEYNLTVSDAVLSPWRDGASAIDEYTTKFGDSISSTVAQLDGQRSLWIEIKNAIDAANKSAEKYAANAEKYHSLETPSVKDINQENKKYIEAKKQPATSSANSNTNQNNNNSSSNNKTIKVGGKINAGSAQIYGYAGDKTGERQYFRNDPIYTVLEEKNGYLKVRHHKLSSGVTGWFKKGDVKAYAKGTTGVDKDQIALIDELGEELVLHAGPNGKLQYLTKGTGVVPADITANLMKLGELNPQEMLDRNRPQITPNKNIVNTEINLDCSVGTLVNIEHCDQNTLPDVEKLVNKAFEKHVQNLNNSLKRFAR